ncbi:putative transcriptional regulator YdeE [Rhizomicrobium palustre]|uniref:Putative transcriptional regulator YdeE n=1 Tax=Rhizomicrobium palustre TaxID=189966 RepID=A0A846N0P4_9PROT|nr:effector binding domain-containing protein [Rhizomicrobium palustre]NIK89055.1 putative transcriptional regulator YdeE [Rhizomicrobium palustre]
MFGTAGNSIRLMFRRELFGPVSLAGYSCIHTLSRDPREMYFKIACQWRDFAATAGNLKRLPPRLGYGVCLSLDINRRQMEYVSCLVVAAKEDVPQELSCLILPELDCAVFDHHGDAALLPCTLQSIFDTVLPEEGLYPVTFGAPAFIQRFSERFDPLTGMGGLEILVPLEN